MHNYYLLQKNGKFSILPWDYNLAFGTLLDNSEEKNSLYPTRLINWGIDSPLSDTSPKQRPLWNVIIENPTYLEQYHEKLSELISKINNYTDEIDKITSTIKSYVETEPNSFYEPQSFSTAIQTLKDFFNLRAESIKKQLSGEIPTDNTKQNLKSHSLVDGSSINIETLGTQGGKPNKN